MEEKKNMVRKNSHEKGNLKRGAWTAHEDKLLYDYIMSHGIGKWRSLPIKAGTHFVISFELPISEKYAFLLKRIQSFKLIACYKHLYSTHIYLYITEETLLKGNYNELVFVIGC